MKPLILCVDDEKMALDALGSQLKQEFSREYSLEFAEDADEGFELIEEFRSRGAEVAVVIADFLMPGLKGDEFLLRVHQYLPNAMKILLTGQIGLKELTNLISRVNLYRFIAKPWDNTDLVMTIRQAANNFMQQKLINMQLEELRSLNWKMEAINQTLETKVKAKTGELLNQRRIFTQFFENSPTALAICDPECNVIDRNPTFEAMFPHAVASLPGQPLIDVIFSEPTVESSFVCKIVAKKEPFNLELKLRRKNHSVIIVEVNGYPYDTASGEKGMFIIFRDLTEQRKTERLLHLAYERRRRDDFFNDIITDKVIRPDMILMEGQRVGVDFQQPLTIFFVHIVAWHGKPMSRMLPRTNDAKMMVDAMVDRLCDEPGMTAWDAYQGIGIVYQNKTGLLLMQSEEISIGMDLRDKLAAGFPSILTAVGIAAFESDFSHFARRFQQAHDAAVTGSRIWPAEGVYHFLDGGAFPLLANLARQPNSDDFLARTIDKIIDYDLKRGSDLFRTLEEIVTTNNLRTVAQNMYLHYKTILFRKQVIEKLLGISLDSFKGRLLIGTALSLYYLREK